MNITALYIRLSLEDIDINGDKKESTSIQNQRLHLRSYLIAHPEIKQGEIKEYIDDGYSGTNFERPAFQEMLEGILRGQVKCIIVKDVSRLGRNYIEVGNYLERIFPTLGVRFISADDNYDSRNSKGDVPGLDVVFKNIIHDHYSKELSHKVIQVKRNLAKKGLFLGGIPPYGYLKDPQDKYRLVIEPESAKVVRQIFALTLEGKGYSDIARMLNRQELDSPAKRLWRLGIRGQTKEPEQVEGMKWRTETITKILQNEVVTGSVVNHRVERKQIGKSSLKSVRKEDYIVAENVHEPIIDRETFDRVQVLIGGNKINRQSQKKEHIVHPLSGIMKCSYCGKNLNLEKGWYCCRDSRVVEDGEGHRNVKANEREILSTLANIIYFMIKLHHTERSGEQGADQAEKPVTDKEGTDAIKEQKLKLLKLYEKYISGDISKSTYMEMKKEVQKQILQVKTNNDQSEQRKIESRVDVLNNGISPDDTSWLTRRILGSVINLIIVKSKTEIEVVWKSKDWNMTD